MGVAWTIRILHIYASLMWTNSEVALITLNLWHILNAMDYYSLNIRFPHNNLIPSFGKEANLGTWTFQNRKKGYLLSNPDFLFLRILKL